MEASHARFERLGVLDLVKRAAKVARGDSFSAEDLEQELALKAWEVFTAYEDRPDEELVKILGVSLAHARADFFRRANRRKRRLLTDAVSLDSLDEEKS